MPMIICPECARRITNNVEKCPNCECTKDKFVTLMDRKEQDLIMLRLGKYQVRFNGKYWNYIQLRKVYELNARQLRRQLRSVYDRTTDFGTIIKSFPHIVETKMKQMLEWSMKLLYECKIPMTAGVFLDKYLEKNHYYVGNWRYYHLDYNEIIDEIVEQYMGIVNNNVAISELKNSVRTQQRLIDGAYHVILAIFYALLNELLENEAIDTLDYKQERENEAMNIHTTTMKYETDDKKIIIGCLNAITKYPYYTPPYATLYEKYKNTPEVTSIFSFLDFFGIDISFGCISITQYMNIERTLKKYIDMEKFNFGETTTDQYYIALEVIDKLQEEYSQSELKDNFNCARLYEYIRHAQEIGASNCTSSKEKQASMEEYIPMLMERTIEIQDEDDIYWQPVWAAGMKIEGSIIFKSDVENICRKGYLPPNKKYLFIFDNTVMKSGKFGFGIFDEGIVFFEKKKIFMFKDITKCKFREDNISMIISTDKDSYEFEYQFTKVKFLKSLMRKMDTEKGECFTNQIVYEIIKHYQNLKGINLLEN